MTSFRRLPNDSPEVILRPNPAGTGDTETMREFMHYITNAFYGATGWNDDNTYKELNATARGRLFCLTLCILLSSAN